MSCLHLGSFERDGKSVGSVEGERKGGVRVDSEKRKEGAADRKIIRPDPSEGKSQTTLSDNLQLITALLGALELSK